MANIAMEVVLEILFLTLSKIEINFTDQEFNWKTYSSDEALPMTKQA